MGINTNSGSAWNGRGSGTNRGMADRSTSESDHSGQSSANDDDDRQANAVSIEARWEEYSGESRAGYDEHGKDLTH